MTYPLCPVCRYQRRPAHILALAMRAVAIPVRDAHEKLNQPTRQRDSQWALGRLDEAKNVAEAHEESCACVEPSDAEIARAYLGVSDPHVTCPICSADVLIPDGTGAFYCRLCRARSAEALIESAQAAPIVGDGFSIAPATAPASLAEEFCECCAVRLTDGKCLPCAGISNEEGVCTRCEVTRNEQRVIGLARVAAVSLVQRGGDARELLEALAALTEPVSGAGV